MANGITKKALREFVYNCKDAQSAQLDEIKQEFITALDARIRILDSLIGSAEIVDVDTQFGSVFGDHMLDDKQQLIAVYERSHQLRRMFEYCASNSKTRAVEELWACCNAGNTMFIDKDALCWVFDSRYTQNAEKLVNYHFGEYKVYLRPYDLTRKVIPNPTTIVPPKDILQKDLMHPFVTLADYNTQYTAALCLTLQFSLLHKRFYSNFILSSDVKLHPVWNDWRVNA